MVEEGDEHESGQDEEAEAGAEEGAQSTVLHLVIYLFSPLCSPQALPSAPAQSAPSAPQSAPSAPAQSAPSAAGDQSSTVGIGARLPGMSGTVSRPSTRGFLPLGQSKIRARDRPARGFGMGRQFLDHLLTIF